MAIFKTRSIRRHLAWAAALSFFAIPGVLLLPSQGVSQATSRKPLDSADRAYADVVIVDQFLSVLTGGAQGLPKMDELNQAMIVKALMEGDTDAAASQAYDYLVSKAVQAIGGGGASAVLSAVGLGKSLGLSAHDFFGEGRLRALYSDLSSDTNASTWPRSYAEAKQDDFVGQRFEIGARPVMLWLKTRDEGRMSDAYYENLAYQSLVAMRDFEMGCDRYGLQGSDRTPEKFQEAVDNELAMAAARARGAHSAELFFLEMNRELVAAEEAARQAAAARDAAEKAEADEARVLEEEGARLEEEAARARAAADSMRAALSAERGETAAATGAPAEPTPETSPESLGITLVSRDQTGSDMTVFRVRVTNNGGYPIRGILPEVRAARLPPGGGVGWTGGEGLRILDPGASAELSFVGTGEIEAAVLYFSARGQVLAARTFEVAHVTEPEPEPTPEPISGGGEWIDLPARFEGTAVYSWVAQMDGQTLTDSYECGVSAYMDVAGVWTGTTHACTVKAFQPAPGPEPGTYVLVSVPVSAPEKQNTLSAQSEGERVNTLSVLAALETQCAQTDPRIQWSCAFKVDPEHLWSKTELKTSGPMAYSVTTESNLERVR